MAENKSKGAQHLTRLDLDISGIVESLEKAKEQIEQYSVDIGKTYQTGLQNGIKSVSEATANNGNTKTDLFGGIEDSAKHAEKIMREIVTKINGEITKLYDKKDLGNFQFLETTLQMSKEGEKLTENIIKDYDLQEKAAKKAAEAQRKELEKQQAIKDNFYKKNATQIDFEIRQREEQGRRFSAMLKQQMQEEAKESAARKKNTDTLIRQLNTLAGRYEVLAARTAKSGNKELTTQIQEQAQAIRNVVTQLQRQEIGLDDAKAKLQEYSSTLPKMQAEFVKSGAAAEGFLKAIQDKARWYAAFQIQYQLINIFKQIPAEVKKTEDAVIELQRVLNTDITNNAISSELYDIASAYGRTFDEVSEVSTKFAQAGYDWNDTVELTRGTMLALNTAELDVTQSTQGLIAILQQWDLEAEDYAETIDKINITADNFAVTSEKIVAALQRASSSAKNANISFEETIGVITAMAEATGRSGENIGTALNSLIVYTTKAASLDAFAGISDRMAEVVRQYRTGATSIFEVWSALSEDISKLNARQQETLLKMTDYSTFADELESDATEYTEKIRSTYETAGTYRQNYFIALLNDMQTAYEVMNNMTDAEGYSVKENEKYMQSYTAMLNQLKSALSELAVGVGESGLLSAMKFIVNTATGIVKLTKSLGGLLQVLISIGSAIIFINRAKISSTISGVISSVKKLKDNLVDYIGIFKLVSKEEGKMAALNSVIGGKIGWMSAATAGLSLVYSAYQGINSAIEEYKEKQRELADSYYKEAQSVQSLKDEYDEIVNFVGDAADKESRLNDFKQKLIKSYYDEKDAIDALNGSRSDEIDFLDEEYAKNIRSAYVSIKDQYEDAADAIENAAKRANLTVAGAAFNIDDKTLKFLEQYVTVLGGQNTGIQANFAGIEFATSNLYEQVDILNEILSYNNLNKAVETELRNILADKTAKLSKYGDIYKEYTDTVAQNYLLQEDIQRLIAESLQNDSIEKRQLLFEAMSDGIRNSLGGIAAQNKAIELLRTLLGLVEEEAEETGTALETAFGVSQEEIEALNESINSLNSAIDNFQSGYDALVSAQDEFNESGYLSVDTIQKLVSLGSEYINVLEFTANGLVINEEKARDLFNAQSKNIDSLIQQAASAEVLNLIQETLATTTGDLATAETEAGEESLTTAEKVSVLTEALIGNSIAAGEAKKQLRGIVGDDAQGVDIDALYKNITAITDAYRNLAHNIGDISTNTGSWSKAASSAASSAAKSATDAQKKALEEQKKAVKERYDAEIAALKSLEAENDRIRKKEEYYRNRQEILDDIERAATRSGIEYREQESEARQKLEDLDREWKETLEDWSIEDKIKELEALRDAEIAAIDAQINALSNAVSTIGNTMVNTAAKANTTILDDYKTNYLPNYEKQTAIATERAEKRKRDMIEMNENELTEYRKKAARKQYENWKIEYYDKMIMDSVNLTSMLLPLNAMTLPNPTNNFRVTSPLTSSGIVNNTNNTSNNSTVFANVYNSGNTKNLNNRFNLKI